MPTLQEYLNSQYPTKEAKEKVKEITTIDNWGLRIINQDGKPHILTKEETKELDGKELNLSEYPNLEKVIIQPNDPEVIVEKTAFLKKVK